mgnify:CR=1 FL=1
MHEDRQRDSPTNEALAARAKAGDKEAATQLWQQNRGLMGIWGRRLYTAYRGRATASGVTLEDVEQIGFPAVAAAACGYDTAQGTQFTTYLAYHFRREFFALVGLRTERQKQEPLCRACSLDAPIDAEDAEGTTRAELVPDAGAAAQMENAEEKIWTEQLHAALEDSLQAIDPRLASVLRQRYFSGMTHTQLAAVMGVSKQHVQSQEQAGLRAMRRRNSCRLAQFRAEIVSRAYRHTGFSAWKTGGSAPERWAEWAEGKAAEQRRAEDRRLMAEFARFEADFGIWGGGEYQRQTGQ